MLKNELTKGLIESPCEEFKDVELNNVDANDIEFVNTIPLLDTYKSRNYSSPVEGYEIHKCDDISLKIILTGDSFTGKTSFINTIRHKSPKDPMAYISTIGIDMCKITLHDKKMNKQIGVQLWDTAGQERFMSLMSSYYKNTCLAMIFFDINKYDSYVRAKRYWYKEATEGGNLVCLVGNKFDKEDKTRRVPDAEIREFVREKRIYYIENDNKTKNGEIAKNNFKYLIAEIIRNKDKLNITQGVSFPKEDYGTISNTIGIVNLKSRWRKSNNTKSGNGPCCIIC